MKPVKSRFWHDQKEEVSPMAEDMMNEDDIVVVMTDEEFEAVQQAYNALVDEAEKD